MLRGMLIDCFTMERKHKAIKRFALDIHNTRADYEHSLLSEVTAFHFSTLDARQFPTGAAVIDEWKRPPSVLIRLLQDAFETEDADKFKIATKQSSLQPVGHCAQGGRCGRQPRR